MNWHSWQEFWQMGGYAAYVWPAFAACMLAMVWEMFSLRQRRKAAQAHALRRSKPSVRPVHVLTAQGESKFASDAPTTPAMPQANHQMKN